jgi:predicted DNA-binding WGR domain protein
MRQNLAYHSGSSNKFWTVDVKGSVITTSWGRMGAKGSSKSERSSSPAAAEKKAAALVKGKLAKGYALATGKPAASSAAKPTRLAAPAKSRSVARKGVSSTAPKKAPERAHAADSKSRTKRKGDSPLPALLAHLPDPLRCRQKNPAAELDRLVKKHPWFAFGFRAGARRLTFGYASDGSGTHPDKTLLVCGFSSIDPATQSVRGTREGGDAPPMTISRLLRQVGRPPPDLKTLWVSFHKQAPTPKPFAELVGAALIQLLGAKATPLASDSRVGLAQRAFGSDHELHGFIGLKGSRFLVLSSLGDGMISVQQPGRRPVKYLSLEGAIQAIADQHRPRLELSSTRFETFSRDNRRLGRGAWVKTPVLRRLVVAAIAEAAGLP